MEIDIERLNLRRGKLQRDLRETMDTSASSEVIMWVGSSFIRVRSMRAADLRLLRDEWKKNWLVLFEAVKSSSSKLAGLGVLGMPRLLLVLLPKVDTYWHLKRRAWEQECDPEGNSAAVGHGLRNTNPREVLSAHQGGYNALTWVIKKFGIYLGKHIINPSCNRAKNVHARFVNRRNLGHRVTLLGGVL